MGLRALGSQLWRLIQGQRAPAPVPATTANTPEQDEDDGASTARAARRLMEVVATLHERGHAGIRLGAALSPSGVHWRGHLYAARKPQRKTDTHSTGAGPRVLLGWAGVEDAPLSALADRVLAEFPELAAAALHEDPAYVAWYADMMKP